MKNKLMTCLVVVFCLTLGTSMSTQAFTNDLSVVKTTDQWQLKMNEANNSGQKYDGKGRYRYYSLSLKNIGQPVSNVKLHGFKGATNAASVKTSLSNNGLSKGKVIESKDFPLFFNTNRFVVVVTWNDSGGKAHQQKFVVTE